MYIWEAINSLLVIIISFFLLLGRKHLRKYVEEKGRNLATKEDIEEITKKVESVKTEFDVFRHSNREVFNNEYSILEEVWKLAWELQACSRSLKPSVDIRPEGQTDDETDQKRWALYLEANGAFFEGVIKRRPFIPRKVYEVTHEIRRATLSDEVRFQVSRKSMSSERWTETIKNAELLDELIDKLNNEIREYVESRCGRT